MEKFDIEKKMCRDLLKPEIFKVGYALPSLVQDSDFRNVMAGSIVGMAIGSMAYLATLPPYFLSENFQRFVDNHSGGLAFLLFGVPIVTNVTSGIYQKFREIKNKEKSAR